MSGYMLFEVVTFLLAFISECHKLSHYNECLHHIAVHRWLVLRISTLNTIRRLSQATTLITLKMSIHMGVRVYAQLRAK